MVSFLDYFPEEKTLLFLDEPNHLAENGEGVEEEYRQSRMHREEKGEANLPEQWLCGFQEVQKKTEQTELRCSVFPFTKTFRLEIYR